MDDSTHDDDRDDEAPVHDTPAPSPFEFRADPRNATRMTWSSPPGPARLAIARAVAFGFGALVIGAAAPLLLTSSPHVGVLDGIAVVGGCALLAAVVAALAVHYALDARGRGRNIIVLHPRHVEFDLAAHRSLTEDTPREAGRVYYNDVAFVETRLEVYRVLGYPLRQRKYRLVPQSGEPVLLFEDREWSTDGEASHAGLARAIATRARVPVRDLGTVNGQSGLFGIVGARAPRWATRTDG